MPFLILADDLSGAAEIAGLAYSLGLSAEVHRAPGMPSDAEVIALDTDSRLLAPESAAARITKAITAQPISGTKSLYKKTDSLLRGNVRAEIEAALNATRLPRALLIPSNPSRDRTIVAGQYLIEGQPLDQTPLASDPHHPRHSADVLTLLGDGQLPLHSIAAGEALPATGIIVPDISSTPELIQRAAALDAGTLPAGAADFFQALLKGRCSNQALLKHRPLAMESPALLVSGSRVAWPERQSAARAAKIPILVADNFGTGPRHFEAMLLGCGDRPMTPNVALWELTNVATRIVQELGVRTVLVEGGATAAALAESLGWKQFTVTASTTAGVGALRPTSPSAPLVLVKPGSYPWPPEIWSNFCSLSRG